jgi:hypothetical protein
MMIGSSMVTSRRSQRTCTINFCSPRFPRFTDHTDQIDVAVEPKTYILQVFGSNPRRDDSYSDCGFSWFSQPFKANTGIVPCLGHDSFLPNRFHFIIKKGSYPSMDFIFSYTDIVLKRTTNCPCLRETDPL